MKNFMGDWTCKIWREVFFKLFSTVISRQAFESAVASILVEQKRVYAMEGRSLYIIFLYVSALLIGVSLQQNTTVENASAGKLIWNHQALVRKANLQVICFWDQIIFIDVFHMLLW